MANTFELIASSTVGSGGAASIDFTSIPSTFTDLCVFVSARSSSNVGGNSWAPARGGFNTSTANFTYRALYGNGSSASSSSGTSAEFGFGTSSSATANTFGNFSIYIPNYAGSTYKSVSTDSVTETNATTTLASLEANLWSNTAAITSIQLTCDASYGIWAQYSTAYLYGVKNA
jgi:hypothetical protein